jgi:lipoteichoic acid synthase
MNPLFLIASVLNRQACSRFIKKAQMELSFSDRIVYGDLLRFYKKNY